MPDYRDKPYRILKHQIVFSPGTGGQVRMLLESSTEIVLRQFSIADAPTIVGILSQPNAFFNPITNLYITNTGTNEEFA